MKQEPVSVFSAEEEKYLKKMKKGESIQFMSADGVEFFACLDKSKIQSLAFILCHISEGRKACFGKVADQTIQFPLADNDFLRVFFDRRDKDNLKFYVNDNGDTVKYSSRYSSELKNERFVMFLEDEYFAQLVLFDSSLKHKISQIIVTDKSTKTNIRTIALSHISQLIPEIKWTQVMGGSFEPEEDGE
ncbi:hypothetical protein ABE504_25250 [Paenibacillus oryzisoli]|uniref:hypothetical protein n=1 Tax=Paenibacillus oryzisoli TaxID=1850517 RepID=UPI003D2B022B